MGIGESADDDSNVEVVALGPPRERLSPESAHLQRSKINLTLLDMGGPSPARQGERVCGNERTVRVRTLWNVELVWRVRCVKHRNMRWLI